MAGPELQEPELDGDDDAPPVDEGPPDEPEVRRVDLGTDGDDIIAGFDGIEEEEEPEEEAGEAHGGPSGGAGGGRGRRGVPEIEEAIESGLGEVAAMGLRGQERRVMQSEMEAVAAKFHIGYFAREVGEKYLKRDLDDIPPEYGLAAALIAFAAVTIYKRPDGEEKVREAVATIRQRATGSSGGSSEPEGSEDEAESEDENE